ncbi:MAG: hypothetical protein OXF52_06415 [Candidatus Dadabacteria bacterium]|nr:hypothetical protein [Candidatus Dadabacteria bacterium]
MPTPTENDPHSKHLFVQLTNPVKQHGHKWVLLTSFSTKRQGSRYDKTRIISKGENKFLHHESYVEYRYTKIESVEEIKEQIDTGKAEYKEGGIEEELIEWICEGLFESKHTPKKALEFYEYATSK